MGKSKQQRPLAVNTGEIILSALKKLMKNTGWTARTIIKFIKIEYRISDPALSGKVSRALKKGVKLGMLRIDRGRYRLNDISELARPVKSNQIRATNHLYLRLQSPKASRTAIVGRYKPKKKKT